VRIAFTTLGCRLNQFETDIMVDQARAAGYTPAPFTEAADVYVINTCTVTERADADGRRLIRQAVRRNPLGLVVVTGCYAQADPEKIAAIEGVDLILGNAEKMEIIRHLRDFAWETATPRIEGRKARIAVGNIGSRRVFQDAPAPANPSRSRPFLKIQDGCNFACTFCIIPAVRGPNRSLPPDQVVQEAKRLSAAGYAEIVLTGINLGTYGWDLKPRVILSQLLERLLEETSIPRIRLSSLHPHEVKGDLIHLLHNSSRLCRHLHLALQSGDDQVLRQMARSYRARHFREVVTRLHGEVPGIAIGADVIVGFPGETEEAFENTRRLLEELPVSYFHVFTYSRRSGTQAAAMPKQVAPKVKARRNRILRQLSAQKFLAFQQACIGHTLSLVVLEERDRGSGLLQGVSDNYLTIHFEGPDSLKGHLVEVRVERISPEEVLGRMSRETDLRSCHPERPLPLLVGA
jgi:threonylcarbamoyladenosine tRNA methylthiotransferase MtaB